MGHRETSLARIDTLHPAVREKALEWYEACWAEGIRVFVVYAYRSYAEQADLYAQGRNGDKRPKVTNARPGHSYHNHRLALDYCLLNDRGEAVWNVNDKWRQAAEIGKKMGFEWGGDWKTIVDYPHIQMTFGLSIKQLMDGAQPPMPKPVEIKTVEIPKEDEEPMTKEEKAAFDQLAATVQAQADKITALEKRLVEVPAPKWAEEAAAYFDPFFNQKTGTIDFWRGLTVQYLKDTAAGGK